MPSPSPSRIAEFEVLSHTLESIGAGVVVADTDGRFIFYNPMAEQITGIARNEKSPDQWQGTFGLFHEDEITPFETEDLPLVRAIRGEEVYGVSMFIRNDVIDEGRHLSRWLRRRSR